MNTSEEFENAGQEYAAAYAQHYTERDLPAALRLYRRVMTRHPGTQEAAFSRSQILNIVNTVIPEQELLEAQTALAVTHFKHERLEYI